MLTLTDPFLGRSKYRFKKIHLHWPNFFWEGGSMDSKNFTLTGPIFLEKKYGIKNVHLNWPLFLGKEEVWIQQFPP